MNIYDIATNEIRHFNRFYTVTMGLLDSSYFDTEYSLAEIRILFEIHLRKICIQNDIVKDLHIDKGYLSRIIKNFCKNGLIEKQKSDRDKRKICLVLTEKGNQETERLIELTNLQIKTKISKLSSEQCTDLCNAMNTMISILGEE